jgi:RND family efflux transporter MFP subunit
MAAGLLSTCLGLASLGLASLPAPAQAEGAARVKTALAVRGGRPLEVEAYGQAGSSSLSVRALSLAQPGQVLAVLVAAGQPVRKGQALLRFQISPTAASQYQEARTAASVAAAAAAHTHELLSLRLATRDQAAAADKAAEDARAALSALTAEGAGRAVIALAAPLPGVVESVAVQAGDRLQAGAPLIVLNPSSGLQVTVGVEPDRRGLIHAGQAVRLEPLSPGAPVPGRVLRIDAALNPKTRLVDVDVAPDAGAVMAGQAFKALIAVGRADGWLVPHEAVQIEEGRAFVFQLRGRVAVRVPVSVRQAGRRTDVVDGALAADRPVVVDGAYQLDDGALVVVER